MPGLVLVCARDAKPKALLEFRAAALTIAHLWGSATQVEPVDSGAELVHAIDAAPGPLRRVACVMHGYWDWLLAPRRGVRLGVDAPPAVVSVDLLAEHLAARGTPDLLVALAACWTAYGRRPSVPERLAGGWLPGGKAYGPGPGEGLAGSLWRRLVAHGLPGATVMAHSTRGHTTRNPALRAWGPQWGTAASVLDAHLGGGAHRLARARSEWVEACRRVDSGTTGAELLMAGLHPRWLPRRPS